MRVHLSNLVTPLTLHCESALVRWLCVAGFHRLCPLDFFHLRQKRTALMRHYHKIVKVALTLTTRSFIFVLLSCGFG
jgi:hypothetical protein